MIRYVLKLKLVPSTIIITATDPTPDDVGNGAEAIVVSVFGCWEQAGVVYKLLGKYASAGTASGLKGYIPQERKPDTMFEEVTDCVHALVNKPQNVARDTRLPGKFVISSSQAFR